MTEQMQAKPNKQNVDAEILAVRALIDESAKLKVTHYDKKPKARASRFPALEPAPTATAAPAEKQPNLTGRALDAIWQRVRSYRPVRKNILATSSVLLVLLHPFIVLSATLFVFGCILVSYFMAGADTFWRRVVTLFQKWERRNPPAARQVKLRAFKFSKKWERTLNWLPDRMADSMRLPELRGLLAADDKHEAALSDRLSRLHQDTVA